jgi:hypothetical protein
VDTLVIAGVIVLHSLLGFFQEWRAEGGLAAPREMAAPHAWVLPDGRPTRGLRLDELFDLRLDGQDAEALGLQAGFRWARRSSERRPPCREGQVVGCH